MEGLPVHDGHAHAECSRSPYLQLGRVRQLSVYQATLLRRDCTQSITDNPSPTCSGTCGSSITGTRTAKLSLADSPSSRMRSRCLYRGNGHLATTAWYALCIKINQETVFCHSLVTDLMADCIVHLHCMTGFCGNG